MEKKKQINKKYKYQKNYMIYRKEIMNRKHKYKICNLEQKNKNKYYYLMDYQKKNIVDKNY